MSESDVRRAKMLALAPHLDELFNEDGGGTTGFVLIVFPLTPEPEPGSVMTISAIDRAHLLMLYQHQIRRLEADGVEAPKWH